MSASSIGRPRRNWASPPSREWPWVENRKVAFHDKGALAQTKFGARMVRAVMWKLSIEDDQGQATVVQLVRSEYSVGRTDENTIRLTERNISRRHARVVKQGAAWFLDDLGSYNGCFVNGIRVVDHQPVNVGDLIQLGDYRLELHADEGVAVAPQQQQARRRRVDTLSTTLNLAAQSDRLVMVVGPTPGREFMLAHAPQRVGRGEECDICVNHSSVSRWHADIQYVGSSRYEIIDHGSSNGIRINGVELRRGLLDARDLIELGDVVLKFIPTGQVYRPSPEESKQLAALLGVDAEGPAPSPFGRLGLLWRSFSPGTRWGALGLVVVTIALFAVSQAIRAGRQSSLNAAVEELKPDTRSTPYLKELEEADGLLGQGNVELAHSKLASIPASSSLTKDPRFSKIETRWAEQLLSRAESTQSLNERETLLRGVLDATHVDADAKRKAEDALARLRAEVASAAAAASSETAADAGLVQDAEAPPSPEPPAQMVAENSPPTKTGKRSQVSRPPTAAPARVASKQGTGPSATELALSGDKESLRIARDALRRKVAAGTATEKEARLLRALCRQLGDTSCLR